MFAWCLITYPGLSHADARPASLSPLAYEPAIQPCRGIVFHDEAWHWAMLHLLVRATGFRAASLSNHPLSIAPSHKPRVHPLVPNNSLKRTAASGARAIMRYAAAAA